MRKQGFLVLTLCLQFASLLAPCSLAGAVWYVDGAHGNDGNSCLSRHSACKSIGHAISLAAPNDAVLVGPAVYYENLTISINLEIVGSGSGRTIIDGQNLDTVIFIPDVTNARVTLAGFTIRNGYSTGNTGGDGGGISSWGTVYAFDLDVNHNLAGDLFGDDGAGAGIHNGGAMILMRSKVEYNKDILSYVSSGGGIYNSGVMTIDDSTIRGNAMEGTDEYGGGVSNGGTLIINRSTISSNSAFYGSYASGGGISNGGDLTLNNSTIYGNSAGGGPGGGIENSGTAWINNSTIANNFADFGTEITTYGPSATVLVQNSIFMHDLTVAGGEVNCSGGITSNGYNLSSDSSCNFNSSHDLSNIEPKLGPLRNNGGPTRTMAELPGSPTIDAGNPEGCTDNQGHLLKTDQRGFPRPGLLDRKHRCDIGAFERQKD